jgi:hypothetical protein
LLQDKISILARSTVTQSVNLFNAAIDDFESISENMPAGMVRAVFLKTHLSSIQIANESEVVLEIFNDLKV